MTDEPKLDSELKPFAKPMRIMNFLLRHRWSVRLMLSASKRAAGKMPKSVAAEQHWLERADGSQLRMRVYRPTHQQQPLPAMLFCHGGGYMIGAPEQAHALIERFIAMRPCVIVAPDYRKAPDAPYPAALDDCYQALQWMQQQAIELNIQPEHLITAGQSAGGGLTAALALRSRDEGGPKIAFQMPLYPMIDDRAQTESASMTGVPVWDAENNALGWQWYLSNLRSRGEPIPDWAAPARCTDYTNLPPTISFVGSCEPFRDETKIYIDQLNSAGVPTRFAVFDGAFHGFDVTAPNSSISKRAADFLQSSFEEFYDSYCT